MAMARRKKIDEALFTAHSPERNIHITGGSELAFRFAVYRNLEALANTLMLTGAVVATANFEPAAIDEEEFGKGYDMVKNGLERMMKTTQFPKYEELARERGGLILDESAAGDC